MAVSCSSLETSKKSHEYIVNKDFNSAEEKLNIRQILSEESPEYITIIKNESDEYVVSTEFSIEVVNTSNNSVSLKSIWFANNVIDKIIIENDDGYRLSTNNNDLERSIKLDQNDSTKLKLIVEEVIEFETKDEFSYFLDETHDLFNNKIRKDDEYYKNLIKNEIVKKIYKYQTYILFFATSKSTAIPGFIDMY